VPPMLTIHDAPVADIDPLTLYRLLALRVDVFVVEQRCAYRELDGRDLEPQARLVWADLGAEPVATLRVLRDTDAGGSGVAIRIGRVATVPAARSSGIAAALMNHALAGADRDCPGSDVVLDAQSHLVRWYERFGFVSDGPDYDEDGIEHRPMRRPGTPGRRV
jgi:ElaA protein